MSAPPPPFSVGETVFVNHSEHSWVVGKVQAAELNTGRAVSTKKHNQWNFSVRTEDPERKSTGDVVTKAAEWDLEMCDQATLGKTPDDLLQLTNLHDSTLLRCLSMRYMNDVVYTNIGAIVVALNPFNYKIPHYQDDRLPRYLAENGNYIRDKLLPHSWSQAHNTYQDLKAGGGENQCILISGESGAGKTEATKIVMRYLSKVSALGTEGAAKEAAESVLGNLVACSPVLESFGNAKTVRNDNSSRFGKLMKVKFDQDFVIMGAYTTKYLLEKSRIITAGKDERVYHSFYLAVRCATARDDYHFTMAPDKYASINSGKCLDNSEFNTALDYEAVCECMKQLGMDSGTIRSTWRAASAVVHQSNIRFEPEGEGSKVGKGANGSDALQAAAALYGVPYAALLEEYVGTTVTVGSETVRKKLPVHKAADVRDALSKASYENLFAQLVDRCNDRCDVAGDESRWIALLDIFGFEDFEFNSFEQLCINLANETLQGHYNEYIFKKDMEECRAEGIDVVDIQCPDNGPCLDLVAGPRGILVALDDECSLGKGTDMGFYDSIVQRFDGKHSDFKRLKIARDTFIVHHYAGSVTYSVTGWLEKNRDTLKPELQQLLQDSTDPVVAALFDDSAAAAKSGKKMTVGLFFKKQLEELMSVINSTNPHWIRCIKPHPAKKPKMFGGAYTVAQLESSGVLGTVKIRKAGYPVRWPHKPFVLKFQAIVPLPKTYAKFTAKDWSQHALAILKEVGLDKKDAMQMGTERVFMKADAYPLLEKRRAAYLRKSAVVAQAVGRGFFRRLKLFRAGKAMVIQRAGRAIIDRHSLFLLFCDVNRARIEEERARRAAHEAFLAAQAAERESVEEADGAVRREMWGDFDRGLAGLDAELELVLRQFREQQRVAALAEEERREEERQAKAREVQRQHIITAAIPIMGAELLDRNDIVAEADEDLQILRQVEWRRRLEMRYAKLLAVVEAEERVVREHILTDSADHNAEWLRKAGELRHKHDILTMKASLDQQLEDNRRRRARARASQQERAANASRSDIERLLLDGALSPPRPAHADPSEWGLTIGGDPMDQQHQSSGRGDEEHPDGDGSARRRRELVAAPEPLDMSPERLTQRLQEHHVKQKLEAAAALRKVEAFEGAALTMPYSAIERGCRVFCPGRSCSGTIIELGPPPRRAAGPRVFKVRFDHGSEAWLELDEVRTPLPGDEERVSRYGLNEVSQPSTSLIRHRHLHTRAASPSARQTGSSAATAVYPTTGVRAAGERQHQLFSSWQRQQALIDEDW